MKRSLITLAACMALGASLSGCGGSGSSAAPESSASTTPAANGGMDAFLAEVSRILGLTNDTSEPAAVDQINVTTPEDKEPAPVT